MVGMVEKEGKIFLNSVRFSKAWNSLGKDIPIKQGNAFPLGQGDVLDIDTGVWASFPDNTIGVLMMLPSLPAIRDLLWWDHRSSRLITGIS